VTVTVTDVVEDERTLLERFDGDDSGSIETINRKEQHLPFGRQRM
jgi:hypothetical protein